ncbi:hypothetical protein [Paraclostridium sp. AKS73]|uniref:hypothetical protein n=1 Tax=Paraclostridium sp. AKS73 TaxID=2876116 RepID=UPI0021E02D5C|nr:hypothetical protein [Paraclostridium sp. AKS73]MCU9814650.1 hypothetical protein [Paraclostridium sp. AKS73]
MDITNIMNTVENSTLLSTLAGALVGSIMGGIITWGVTSSSLKKQLKYQKEIIDLQETKKEKMVLVTLKSEIYDNLTKLDIMKKTLDETEESLDLEKENMKDLLKEDYWKQYRHMLGYMDNIDFKNELLGFYNLIDIFKSFGCITVEYMNTITEKGEELICSIDALLSEYNT